MSIEAVELSKSFGPLKVVDRLSLKCIEGEVGAVVGPNGAGKTTLFKMLLGLLTPDKGTVIVPGKDKDSVRGFVEKPSLYPYLSAFENLSVFARYQKLKLAKEEIGKNLVSVGLDPRRSDPIRHYSMGMKQRLGIAAALLSDPKTLILDEPFSGLDPTGIRDLSILLRRLALDQQMAVLISSHFMDQLIRFCDRIYVVVRGQIIDQGSAREIMSRHTSGYLLEGPRLTESTLLNELGAVVNGTTAFVDKDTFKAGLFLQKLAAEGTAIVSCIPKLDLDHLFEEK